MRAEKKEKKTKKKEEKLREEPLSLRKDQKKQLRGLNNLRRRRSVGGCARPRV